MFLRAKKSIIDQIADEDSQLASILNAINQLYKMADFKLSYIHNIIKSYNSKRLYIKHKKSAEFLESNKYVCKKLKELIKSEKRLETDEKYRNKIFKKEIKNIGEAIELIKKLENLIIMDVISKRIINKKAEYTIREDIKFLFKDGEIYE